MLSFQGIAEMINIEWFQQFPLLVIVSMGGGLLGAAFNYMRKRLLAVSMLQLIAMCQHAHEQIIQALHAEHCLRVAWLLEGGETAALVILHTFSSCQPSIALVLPYS